MYNIIKRAFDIIVALIALILLLPLFIPIMILLRFTGEGEIFYRQKRIGYKNSYFDILKFATMLKNSLNMGTGSITLRNDPRVTKVGHFLRITKLNELPQIFNVLKGDMSLIGPRPLVDKTFNAYPSHVREIVYNSKPGISGIGSIIFRDEESLISNATISAHDYYEQVIAPYKGELELWYQKNKTFMTDIKLIFLTAWVILNPKSDLPYNIFKDLPKRNF
jgi:lipopolysaccharide/colanic/teichoic acid biosynthesis glycosyltransferase